MKPSIALLRGIRKSIVNNDRYKSNGGVSKNILTVNNLCDRISC